MLNPKLKRVKDEAILSLNDVHLVTGYQFNKLVIALSIDALTNHNFNGVRLDISQAMEVINKTHDLLSSNYSGKFNHTHNIISQIPTGLEDDTYDMSAIMRLFRLTQDDVNRLCMNGTLERVEVSDFVDLRLTKRSVNRYATGKVKSKG